MSDGQAFDRVAREVDALERVQADLAAVASRSDDARRQDLIDLRRKLSAQIAIVGQTAEPIFATAGETDLLRAYRAIFSAMRSAAALHQANWPAVRLGEALAEYRASAQNVRDANREFVAWMRAALARLERQ